MLNDVYDTAYLTLHNVTRTGLHDGDWNALESTIRCACARENAQLYCHVVAINLTQPTVRQWPIKMHRFLMRQAVPGTFY